MEQRSDCLRATSSRAQEIRIARDWLKREEAKVIKPTEATIDEPRKEQEVTRNTFIAKGHATGVLPNTHLWLVIEADDHVWPKERELHVLPDGSWESTVYEDGRTKRFALAVYSADPQAEKFINDWLEDGKRTEGKYKAIGGIPGTERLARVDDLRPKPK